MEEVHSVGHLHCDIKADNICIGIDKDEKSMSTLKLIDFGISEPYIKISEKYEEPQVEADHVDMIEKYQKGNIVF